MGVKGGMAGTYDVFAKRGSDFRGVLLVKKK